MISKHIQQRRGKYVNIENINDQNKDVIKVQLIDGDERETIDDENNTNEKRKKTKRGSSSKQRNRGNRGYSDGQCQQM